MELWQPKPQHLQFYYVSVTFVNMNGNQEAKYCQKYAQNVNLIIGIDRKKRNPNLCLLLSFAPHLRQSAPGTHQLAPIMHHDRTRPAPKNTSHYSP